MKIKVPEKIKIATHIYKVGYRENLKLDDNYSGSAHHRAMLIEIDPLQSPSNLNETLLHEVIHIIERIYGCDLGERDIDRVSQGVAELLFNNLGIEFDWSDIKKLE